MIKLRTVQQVVATAVMAAILVSGSMLFQISHAAADLQVAPLNPAFVEWQDRQSEPFEARFARKVTVNGEKRFLGLKPSPLDFSHLKNNLRKSALQTTRKSTVFLASYDLRTTNKLTPVRDQNSYGTCWAFATMAAIESYLKPSEIADFSEKQLAYIAYAGDSVYFTAEEAYQNDVLNQGGDMWKATALLARWSGPVNEADVPYGDDTPFDAKPVQKHLQLAIYLPHRTADSVSQFNPDNIKSAIMKYGAVAIGMNYSDDLDCFNEETFAYYYSGQEGANHEVNIVGWKDAFPKENFTNVPAGDGAWIVRNSWGESYGDGGYFYISYHDTSLDDGVALVVEDVDNYDTIYQYDPLGWITSIGSESGSGEIASFANMFTATQVENLKAVSFYAPTDSTQYTITVYKDCQSTPDSGQQAASPQSGTITEAGYHTIVLDTPVSLSQNEVFSVVVNVNTPGYNYPVPVESVMEGYSDNATAGAGQSFVSLNGGSSWVDLTTITSYEQANVCLKAFASKVVENQPYIILSDDSALVTLSSQGQVEVFGSSGTNTVTIETGAQVKCFNFAGANVINFAEAFSQFTITRSGATVYLRTSAGTDVRIPATLTSQTLGFSDQSLQLVITNGSVMLGSQVINP
ncbi:MAG: surface layer protein B [Desulfobacteraceae bacterium]|nr:surface layer protein B [Desulfobacteraceae bacterium]